VTLRRPRLPECPAHLPSSENRDLHVSPPLERPYGNDFTGVRGFAGSASVTSTRRVHPSVVATPRERAIFRALLGITTSCDHQT
jgi:hypothetical protein